MIYQHVKCKKLKIIFKELLLIIFIFLRSIKKADLLKYVETHYKVPWMVLAGAGGINHDQLVHLSEEHFGKWKTDYQGEVPDLLPCLWDDYNIRDSNNFCWISFSGSEIRIRDDEMALAHIVIAVESPPDGRRIPLHKLSAGIDECVNS